MIAIIDQKEWIGIRNFLKTKGYDLVQNEYFGAGSFGVVVPAKITATGKNVVIKISQNKKELEIEAKTLAKLVPECQKSAIICYKDYFEEDKIYEGYAYLVIEYLQEWESLEDFIRKRETKIIKMDEEELEIFYRFEVPQIINQLISALRVIHSQGLVHHDIKPDNIMISKELEPGSHLRLIKIIDFGLACDKQSCTESKRGGFQTHQYTAPEVWYQFESNRKKTTMGKIRFSLDQLQKIDLWALGATIMDLVNLRRRSLITTALFHLKALKEDLLYDQLFTAVKTSHKEGYVDAMNFLYLESLESGMNYFFAINDEIQAKLKKYGIGECFSNEINQLMTIDPEKRSDDFIFNYDSESGFQCVKFADKREYGLEPSQIQQVKLSTTFMPDNEHVKEIGRKIPAKLFFGL